MLWCGLILEYYIILNRIKGGFYITASCLALGLFLSFVLLPRESVFAAPLLVSGGGYSRWENRAFSDVLIKADYQGGVFTRVLIPPSYLMLNVACIPAPPRAVLFS